MKETNKVYWLRGMMEMRQNRASSLLRVKGIPKSKPGVVNYRIPRLPKSLLPSTRLQLPDNTRVCFAASNQQINMLMQLLKCSTSLNFACLKRNVTEPKPFTDWCNSDNAESGSQVETTEAMNEGDCKICNKPMFVECRAKRAGDRGKKQVDKCGGKDEKVYSCLKSKQPGGKACFPKQVRGKCYPGLDECKIGLHDCGPNTQCVDEYYGYRCLCNRPGYVISGGKCKKTRQCQLKKSDTSGMTIRTNSGSLLDYATRCKFSMASSCADKAVENDDRPNYKVEVQSIMNPADLSDFSNVRVTVTLTLRTEKVQIVIHRVKASAGKVEVNGKDESLPFDGLTSMDVRIKYGVGGAVVLTRAEHKDLRIEVCPSPDCLQTVLVRVTKGYAANCGVCGIPADSGDKLVETVLNENRAADSEVTCAAPTEPPGTIEPEITEPEPEPEPERPLPTLQPPLPATSMSPPTGGGTTPAGTPQTPSHCTSRFSSECDVILDPKSPFSACADKRLFEACVKMMCDGGKQCDVLNKLLRRRSCTIASITQPMRLYMEEMADCKVRVKDDCEQQRGGDDQCGILRAANGPFANCTLPEGVYTQCLTGSCTKPKKAMCDFLTAVADDCQSLTPANRRQFMMVTKCTPICGPNMRFSFNVHKDPPSCEDPYEIDSTGDNGRMACVCDVAFLMSRGKCTPKADCGCHVGSEYHERGTEWMSDDCTKRYRCNGLNEVTEFDETCAKNSKCDGKGRCVCVEGSKGDCCSPVEDRGNMTCYKNCDGSSVCSCKMGYASLCGSCIDLDECLTGQHNCEPQEKCVNLDGGFKCKCANGYLRDRYTQKCKDINECANQQETGVGLCPEGSQCVNRDPFFECVCCSGFVQTFMGCLPDPKGPRVSPKAPCCRCMGIKCLLIGSFCYKEGDGTKIDYDSYRDMYQRRCLESKPVLPRSYAEGKCGSPAPTPNPTGPPKGTKPPTGETPPPGEDPCGDKICSESQKSVPPGGAVCQEAGKVTYPNVCELAKAACKSNNNSPAVSLPAFSNGPCPTPTTPPPVTEAAKPMTFTPWGTWSTCLHKDPSVTCGAQGTHFRERQKSGGPGTPTEDQIRQRVTCSLPACPNQPPATPPTTNCKDPSQCPKNPAYLCARIDNGAKATYTSECHLKIAACQQGASSYLILHDGRCLPNEEKPKHLPCTGSVIPREVKTYRRTDLTTGEVCVGNDVEVAVCDGGFCQSRDPDVCCEAVEFQNVESQIVCRRGDAITSQRVETYISATRCDCKKKNHSGEE